MAKVLGVHGAFHELWGPQQIRGRWVPALQDGVVFAGGDLNADSVEIAFYGDLFRHRPGDGGLDDDALREVAHQAGLDEIVHNAFGEDGAAILAKAIGEDMLRRTIDQAGRYLGDETIRAQVQARVLAAIAPDTRVLVAHSLGTLVTYEVLCDHPEIQIDTYVTIGSPLGNAPLVMPHLRPQWPGSLRRWVNVTAPTDQVCAGVRLADTYDPRVEDNAVDNGHRGHSPEPYLCSHVVGEAVWSGCQ